MKKFEQYDLARLIAAEYGGDVVSELDRRLAGEVTRGFGMTEAMAIAALIAQCAQLAISIYQMGKDRSALAMEIDNKATRYPQITPEDRKNIITNIASKLESGILDASNK